MPPIATIRIYLLAIGLWFLPIGVVRSECPHGADHGHIHWSDFADLPSPNGMWKIQTAPLFDSDENQTPVVLVNCARSTKVQLLTLSRSADFFWSPDGSRLLIIDKPVANAYEIHLYGLERVAKSDSIELMKTMNRRIKEKLVAQQGGRIIEFFLPSFSAWTPKALVLALGGASSPHQDGPMSSFCYGITIDLNGLEASRFLSEEELKLHQSSAMCILSPGQEKGAD